MIKVKCRGYEGYLTELLSDANTKFMPDGTMLGAYNIEIWPDNRAKVTLTGVDGAEIEIVSQ